MLRRFEFARPARAFAHAVAVTVARFAAIPRCSVVPGALVVCLSVVGCAGGGSSTVDRAALPDVRPQSGAEGLDQGADPHRETRLSLLEWENRREVTAEMLALAESEAAEIRGRLALALGRIGRAEDVPVLAALLADPEPEVRRWAAFGLGEIEDSTAAYPLEVLLLSEEEPDAQVRELAVEGLGKLRRGADACAIALHDGNDLVQTQALYAAWKIPASGEVESILQMTNHKLGRVRAAATYCLMRFLGTPPSGRTPVPGGVHIEDDMRDRVTQRFLALTRDKDVRVVLPAVRGLRRAFEPDVTERLGQLTSHPDWKVRVEALRALGTPEAEDDEGNDGDGDGAGDGGNTDSGDAETGNTETEETASTQTDASTGRVPGARPIDMTLLRIAAADTNPNVALTALGTLSTLGTTAEAEAGLSAALFDPRPRFRIVALETFLARSAEGELPSKLRQAIELLARDENWAVRAATIAAATRLEDGKQEELLGRLSQDEGSVAKLAVGPYLQFLFDRDSSEESNGLESIESAAAPFLRHEDPMVALMALSKVGEIYASLSPAAAEDSAESGGEESGPTDSDAGPTAPPPSDADWNRFAATLASLRTEALSRPDWADVRQSIVTTAAEPGTHSAMRQIVLDSCSDPNFVVRQEAVRACEALELDAPREAGPVDTRFSRAELAEIDAWSRRDHLVRIEIGAGTIEARLFSQASPLTCWNFAELANSEFYDNGNWHRVVPNFVVQDGCPRGDGWGGPDHQIRCEINRHRYTKGALGMALAGKDTGGSQFFFTHSDQPHLDGGYTVFGEVRRGQDLLDHIVQGTSIETIRVVDE